MEVEPDCIGRTHHEPGAAGARCGPRAAYVVRLTQASEERSPLTFSDLPFQATSRYVIQNRLDEAFPPRTLLQDPRTESTSSGHAVEEPAAEHHEEGEEGNAGHIRTRSAAQDRRGAEDELELFDKEEAHERLAAAASEHYAAMPPPKESDAIVGFLYRCRAGDSVLKIV